jgi:hypothetical protein
MVLRLQSKCIDRKNVFLTEWVNGSFDLVKNIGSEFVIRLLYIFKITY